MEIKNTTPVNFEIMKKYTNIFILLYIKSHLIVSILAFPFLLFFLLGINLSLRSAYKKKPLADKKFFYTFKDDAFDIVFDSESESSNNSFKYSSFFCRSSFFKICETPKCFYIYDLEFSYPIDKSGFENPGDSETVASVLKSFIPAKKYIIYKK